MPRRTTTDRVRPALPRAWDDLAHGDGEPLDGVVRVPAEAPRRIDRLLVAGLVTGAAPELVLAGPGRLPAEPPRDPGPGVAPRPELRLPPGRAQVRAHLDAVDRRPARPGPALEL